MKLTNLTPPDRCWNCKAILKQNIPLNSAQMLLIRAPLTGDITCCINCGEWSVFDDLLHLVKPSDELDSAIRNTPELTELQEYIKQQHKQQKIILGIPNVQSIKESGN